MLHVTFADCGTSGSTIMYICHENKNNVQLLHFCIQNVVNTQEENRKRSGKLFMERRGLSV